MEGQSKEPNAALAPAAGPDAAAAGSGVRPVTDHEVAFFDQNGWVFLPGLVERELARAVLERGKPRLAHLMDGGDSVDPMKNLSVLNVSGSDEGMVANIKQWIEWRGPVRAARDPVFARVSADPVMGRNVSRLFRREHVPPRIYHDMLVCKLPDQISTRTSWHQDSTNFPLDRNALTIWIALEEITPEMAPVQFLTGSHRCGMLGGIPATRMDLMDEYPELARFHVSPPHHMQPGDATVHHGLVVHGAGSNNTSNPRWSYIAAYFPSDARYTGAPNHDTDGFGLQRGQTLEHPSFTLVDG